MQGLHPLGYQKLSPEALLGTAVLAVVAGLVVMRVVAVGILMGGAVPLFVTAVDVVALRELPGVETAGTQALLAVVGVVGAQVRVIVAVRAALGGLMVVVVVVAVIVVVAPEHRVGLNQAPPPIRVVTPILAGLAVVVVVARVPQIVVAVGVVLAVAVEALLEMLVAEETPAVAHQAQRLIIV
jgi:hypothetical protein